MDLFDGFPDVGSKTSYGRGWNDCLAAVRSRIERMDGQWVPTGYIHLPTTRVEAEMMHLISENWLKQHTTGESEP